MIELEIWNSKAWKKLTGASKEVFMFLRTKAHGRFEDAKTLIIKVSYREISKQRGIAISTGRKSIVQLENLGFIDFVTQGGLKSGGYSKNEYKLSERYLKYEMVDFKRGKLKEQHGVFDRGFGLHKKFRYKPQRQPPDSARTPHPSREVVQTVPTDLPTQKKN